VQSFEPAPLEADGMPARLRPGGVYLITGGLGGVGLAVAEHLARRVQARLVLVGRSELPPREDWEALLPTLDATEGTGRKLRHLLALEAAGAEVLALSADVSDLGAMQRVVDRATERFGVIHGVLHAAGVPGAGLIQLKTPAMAAEVFKPKVWGAALLSTVFADMPLDFLAFFSSMSSVTGGGAGQMDYCAANAFLDALALQRARRHPATFSIDWGEWEWNGWEAGLASLSDEVRSFFRDYRRKFGITFAEGGLALERILAHRLPQLLVSTQDFLGLVELNRSLNLASLLKTAESGRRYRPAHPRPVLGTPFVAPRGDLEQRLAAVWQRLLGIEQVGADDNFFELGGNSLLGVDLISTVGLETGAELPAYALYEAPTVAAMARRIESGTEEEPASQELSKTRGERRRERSLARERRMAGGPTEGAP